MTPERIKQLREVASKAKFSSWLDEYGQTYTQVEPLVAIKYFSEFSPQTVTELLDEIERLEIAREALGLICTPGKENFLCCEKSKCHSWHDCDCQAEVAREALEKMR